MSKKSFKVDELVEAVVEEKVLDAIIARLDEKITKTIQKLLKAQTDELKASMEKIACNVAEKLIAPVNDKIDILSKENTVLKSRIEQLEVYSRSDNLIFHGLPESDTSEIVSGHDSHASHATTPAESHGRTEKAVMDLCEESLGVVLDLADISTAHRIPRGKGDKVRPIIVRFTTRRIRDDVYRARRKLRERQSTPVYINENLTRSNAHIFSEARRLLKIKKISGTWTNGGFVFIKRTTNPAFSCAPLLTPENAVVDDACPKFSASSGVQCHHRCADGFIQTEGDQTRICEKDVGWSGSAIVCTPVIRGYCPAITVSHGTHVEPDVCMRGHQPIGTVCHQFCQPRFLMTGGNYSRTCVANQTWTGYAITCINQTVVVEVGHPERNHEVGLIVGLTIGMLLISTFIVIAVVALCRYGSPKTFRRHFHESSDFCFHNVDDDLQPVIPPAGLSAPVYYTKHNSATSDGSVSFDNPAYANANNGLAEDKTAAGYGLASAISRIRNMRSSGPSVESASAHPDATNDQFVFTNPASMQALSSEHNVGLRVAKLENASQSVA